MAKWLTSLEIYTATRVQILDVSVCISRRAIYLSERYVSNFSSSGYG